MNKWVLLRIRFIIVGMLHFANFSIISLPYHYTYCNNEITVLSGSNKQCSYLQIDLKNELSWLSFKNLRFYQFNHTIILNDNVEFTFNSKLYRGQTIKDSIVLKDDYQILFQFSIVTQIPELYSSSFGGALGLPFSFSDTNLSLIHKFKEEGFIDHLSFSINGDNRLSFGGISEEDTIDKFYSYCNVIGINSTWSCNINGVILTNGTREYHYPMTPNVVIFTTSRSVNYVPKAFFEFMVTEYFKIGIDKNNIYQLSNYQNKKIIYSLDDRMKEGHITLMIDNYSYKVELDSFWDCYEFGCDLNIFENPDGDHWIIGHSFYHYYQTVFDYENKQMQFYSNSGVKEYEGMKLNDTAIKGLMYVNMSIMIIGLCFVLSARFTNKNILFNNKMIVN